MRATLRESIRVSALLAACLTAMTVTSLAQDAPQETAPGSARLIVFGDLHGQYLPFVSTLRDLKLVDESLHWTGGKTQLVAVGDLLDRGPGERDLLELLMRLEGEAVHSGGRVHVLLGNHEVMNLSFDFRYVAPTGYAAFAADENPQTRELAYKAFLARQGDAPLEFSRQAFDQSYPKGYFARRAAFSRTGRYGSWLLSKPFVLKLGEYAFVHGGLTEETASLGVEGINRRAHKELNAFLSAFTGLQRQGILDQLSDFSGARPTLRAFLSPAANNPRATEAELRQAAATVLNARRALPYAADGPVWYRGNSLENERIERGRIDAVLESLGATTMIVGHTPTDGAAITSRFEKHLLRVDVGTTYGNDIQALVIEGGSLRSFDEKNDQFVPILAEAPQGTGWSQGIQELPDEQVERLLRLGHIQSIRPLGRGSTKAQLAQIEMGTIRLRGLFKTVDKRGGTRGQGCTNSPAERYRHEVAAYKIDREIGLGMVPVTTLRTLRDTTGSMQLWVEDALDHYTVDAYHLEMKEPERLPLLRQRARIFDALIGNYSRRLSDQLYLLNTSEMLLVDHSRALCLRTELSPLLGGEDCVLEPFLRSALAALDKDRLRLLIGEYSSKKQRMALLTRRDAILELCR